MFRQLERQLDKTESLVELLAKRMNGMPMESTSTDHHVDLPPISIGGFFPLHFIPSELDSSAPPPLPPSDNQSTVQLPELPDLTSLETQTTQGLIRNNWFFYTLEPVLNEIYLKYKRLMLLGANKHQLKTQMEMEGLNPALLNL